MKPCLISSMLIFCVAQTAFSASPYLSYEPLEKQLPMMIIGSLAGIFLFVFINWLFKVPPKTKKKR